MRNLRLCTVQAGQFKRTPGGRRFCREMEPEDLPDILARLKGHRVRSLLSSLYFSSSDPHLNGREVQMILERLEKEGRLKKATKGLDKGHVAAVLRCVPCREATNGASVHTCTLPIRPSACFAPGARTLWPARETAMRAPLWSRTTRRRRASWTKRPSRHRKTTIK